MPKLSVSQFKHGDDKTKLQINIHSPILEAVDKICKHDGLKRSELIPTLMAAALVKLVEDRPELKRLFSDLYSQLEKLDDSDAA